MLARVEASLRDGWKRDRDAEERAHQHGVLGPWDYCFSCTAKSNRPAAGFWVHARTPTELFVANVVPLMQGELTEQERSQLLAEFEREFLRPASEVGVETEINQRRQNLEYHLSGEAFWLLEKFSKSANRACLQANDRQVWNAFVIRAHQDDSTLSPAILDEWLHEEGWVDEIRSQLVREYELGRDLLLAYDEQIARR